MNDKVYPKRIGFLLDMLYKDYPVLKRHPDYNIYYLYTNHPQISEYVFITINDYLIGTKFSEELNYSLQTYKTLFHFTECSIISYYEFEFTLKKNITEEYNRLRGTDFNIIFYEIW